MYNTLILLSAQSGAESGDAMANYIFLAMMFIVIYFFMIRPQSKKAKEQQTFIDNISKGDKIVTTSGIHGKIMKVNDNIITLMIDRNKGITIEIERSAISKDLSARFNEDKES